jgi:soluble lytic murein transglycosylase-like protein
MLSTRLAAVLTAAVILMAAFAAAPAPAQARKGDPCANQRCTRYKPHATNCWDKSGRRKVARCFISQAATHFRQSKKQAFHTAWRESRYDWHATNRSSGAAGLYQFMPSTWRTTPYRKHSPYHPRWAALAAMWMWKHGGYSHWR